MLKNYFKIAIRNLLKQKLFSFINILSLTVGLTCAILLGMYVMDELSFDKFNVNRNSLYRVVQVSNLPDGSLQYEGIFHSIALGPALVSENPTVESTIRFFKPWPDGKYYVKQQENSFYDKVLYGDFEIFEAFSFPLLKGSIDKNNLHSVVITERAAHKYFGDADPINKTLAFRLQDEYVDFTVAAVCKNIPSNSSIQFDVLLPFNHIATVGELSEWQNSWGFGAIITYVKLKEGTDPSSLSSNLSRLMGKYYPNYAVIAKERGYASSESYRHFRLEPLTDVHFNTNVSEGLVLSSDPMYSYILMLLVVAILAIACFNFMNLSISRSVNRVKEVGLRKAIGALRKQLIVQFMGESILMSSFAFAISFLLVDLLLPLFNYLTNKQIDIYNVVTFKSLTGMIFLSIVVGAVAGFYPAFMLSKFTVRDSLAKGNIGGSSLLRQSLVTLQFGLSTMLIIGVIVMNRQVDFLKNTDLGFDANHVLVLRNAKVGETSIYNYLKSSTSSHSGIQSITSANQTFANPSGLGGRGFTYKGEQKRVGMITVTEDYIQTLGIELVEGRPFNPDLASDFDQSVIVNEACLKDFELTVDKPFEELTRSPETDPLVVGVMRDFNYSSLKFDVLPMLIKITKAGTLENIFIKISAKNTNEVISFLKTEWETIAPDLPFEYNFLTDTMRQQYLSEERWGSIISYSMGMATILSCLGLFGIVSLGMESRKKEIGIRKVLGAQVRQIIWLVTGNYLRLVVISFTVAIPISYYVAQKWLLNFAYKIEVSSSVFLQAAITILLVACITISIKIVKAALGNPVEAIRSE